MSKILLTHALCMYVGTKSVKAVTMSRGEYNEYRGWQIPEDEDPSEAGYLVEYVDGGKPNDQRHAGYISWSPADVFERSYKQAPKNHIERMEVEASELQAKIDGAQKFLDSLQEEDAPLICDEQFDLLEKQLKYMKAYLITLRRRIKFDKEMFNAIGVKD